MHVNFVFIYYTYALRYVHCDLSFYIIYTHTELNAGDARDTFIDADAGDVATALARDIWALLDMH